MKNAIRILFLLQLHSGLLSACCNGEPHSLTELLLQDQYHRNIFLCTITRAAADLHGAYFSKAEVTEVFKGKMDSVEVIIHTGGNTSAGGRQTTLYTEWLIFSPMYEDGSFAATVCDWFSCNSKDQPQAFYHRLQIVSAYKKMVENAYSGAVIWYHPDGTKAAEGHFLHGKPDGTWKHYREDGTMKSQSNYRNGVLHGTSKRIEPNRPVLFSTYNEGKLLRQKTGNPHKPSSEMTIIEQAGGIQVKHYKTWHPNGKLATDFYEQSIHSADYTWYFHIGYDGAYLQKDSFGKVMNQGAYLRGAKIGSWVETDPKTKVQSTPYYAKPAMPAVNFYCYYETGELKTTGNLKDGKPEGKWTYFGSKGYVTSETNFKAGEKSGEEKHFHYLSEKVSARFQYENGQLQGQQESYFENGAIQQQYFCQNGQKQGAEISYLKPGIWQIKAHYKNGMLDGAYISLDFKGDTSLVASFREGALEGPTLEYGNDRNIQQKRSGTYKDGYKTGVWNSYGAQGKLIEQCSFNGPNSKTSTYHSFYGGECRKVE